jgi:chromosome partitioning protein
MAAKIITIAQQKGGAGKTTLAAQLGVAFSAAGKKVALVDIDPQASLAAWHQVRKNTPADTSRPLEMVQVAGYRATNELTRLKRANDIVIIDSPPHAETEAKVAVRAADLVLIPVQPSPMDIWATGATMDLARTSKVPVLLVLNRVPPRGKVIDMMRQQLAKDKLPVATAALGNRVAFVASMLEGQAVVETAPGSAASTEIRNLVKEIESKL